MARGSRGGGSRSHSGGGRSRSRSGGGRSHSRSSSSSRSYSSSSGYHHSNHHHHYGGSAWRSSRCYRAQYDLDHNLFFNISIKLFVATVVTFVMLFLILDKQNSEFKNTIERTKLETGNSFMTGCVIDEANLFPYEAGMESRLKEFWMKTGVQPVIITNEYTPEVTSDDDAFDWGCVYYDEHINREDVFLCVFFNGYGNNPDEGYVAVVGGYQSDSVMDSAAIEMWWNYFDRYWYTDCDWEALFVRTYLDTGDAIMTVSTNGWDALIWVVIAFIVLAVIAGVIIVLSIKRKAAKEKANADAAILNADISKSKAPTESDALTEKYL